MPTRIRAHPVGYPITPPVSDEEVEDFITFDQITTGFMVYKKVFNTGETYVINANENVQMVLPPGDRIEGSDTIQGSGTWIGFEL